MKYDDQTIFSLLFSVVSDVTSAVEDLHVEWNYIFSFLKSYMWSVSVSGPPGFSFFFYKNAATAAGVVIGSRQ